MVDGEGWMDGGVFVGDWGGLGVYGGCDVWRLVGVCSVMFIGICDPLRRVFGGIESE